MNKQELVETVNFILSDGYKDLQMYGFIAGDDNAYRIALTNDLETELINVVAKGVQSLLVEKEYEIVGFSTSDERKNRYYLYDLEEIPVRMAQMSFVDGNHNVDHLNLQQHKVDEINTVIFNVSDGNGHSFSVYKVLSTVEKVVKSTHLVLAKFGYGEGVLKEEKDPLMKIGPRFQIVYTDNRYIFLDSSSIESTFKLNQILNNEASKNIQIIAQTRLLKNVDKLQHYAEKTAFSRKLVGVMSNSKVIKDNISKDRVFRFIENDAKLRKQLKIDEVKGERFININSIQSAKCFLDLLNDEFLRSDLTGQEYQAVDKDER